MTDGANGMRYANEITKPMRFAYADPPYLNYGKRHYGYGEWDQLERHQELVEQLVAEFPDGWALSASSSSLRLILPLCPENVRVASWVKPFHVYKRNVRPAYAWEPVIFWRGRNPPIAHHPPPLLGGKATTPKDFCGRPPVLDAVAVNIALQKGLVGAKPEAFCRWVLDLLNFHPGDELVDLFPGTGVMGLVAARVAEGVA